MAYFRLDALGSLLNVLGAAVLALDALVARRRTIADIGNEALRSADSQVEEGSEDRRKFTLASWSFWRAVVGFSLVVLGFAIDLYTKVTLDNPLLRNI